MIDPMDYCLWQEDRRLHRASQWHLGLRRLLPLEIPTLETLTLIVLRPLLLLMSRLRSCLACGRLEERSHLAILGSPDEFGDFCNHPASTRAVFLPRPIL
jgi:hypothetical protein